MIYMLKINKIVKNLKLQKKIKMIIQVHDELIFEIYDDNIYYYTLILKKIINKFNSLSIAMDVDIKISSKWLKK